MSDIIVEWVYWYPPSQMIPNSVSSIVSDNTGNLQVNFIEGNYFFGGLTQQNIIITPQAYANWFVAQKQYMSNTQLAYFQSIYTAQISAINGYSSNILYEGAVLKKEGYYWLPYQSAINDTSLINNTSSNPSSLSTSELYALIKSASNGSPNTTTLSNQQNNPNAYQNNGATSYSYITNPFTNAQNTNLANYDTSVVNNNTTSQTLSASQLYANTGISGVITAISNAQYPTIPQFLAGADLIALAEIGGIILIGYIMLKYGI